MRKFARSVEISKKSHVLFFTHPVQKFSGTTECTR